MVKGKSHPHKTKSSDASSFVNPRKCGSHPTRKSQFERHHKKVNKYQLNINSPKINWEKNVSKKKKLKPLKAFYIHPTKDINKMKINELKEFAHKFDLNPEINFKILSYLKKNSPKEYNKYIPKYKYTLNFKDALELKCFDEKEIILMMKEYNNNIYNFNIGLPQIKANENIISFSKIRLFNLFFYLQDKDILQSNYDDILKNILSYSIPQTLIFKIPNNFGNYELKYYTYLLLFINLLVPGNNKDIDSNNESKDFTSSLSKEIFFNFDIQEKVELIKVNLNEFEKRKKILKEYVKGFNTDDNNTTKKSFKMKKKKNDDGYFIDKIHIFQTLRENIIEIIKLDDEKEIIDRIKFISYLLLFKKKNQTYFDKLSNCLRIKDSSKNINYNNICYLVNKGKEQLINENYAISNIDIKFSSNNNNPFNFKAYYYLFPDLLKKNIIQNDKDLFDSFKNYLKMIYTSPIIKDIFYLTSEFQEFMFPFDDNDILEEMFEYTIFLPFPNDSLLGFTEKEIPEILISAVLKEEKPMANDFSKMVCQLSQILNTCLHEHIKHYIKALIFYNSFHLGITKRINSNLNEIDEERKLINSILFKNKNNYKSLSLDGGEKAEVFLYGNVLNIINFRQSLELFKPKNWEKTIPEHIENFNKNKISDNKLEFLLLKQITQDDNLCDFYKILAKKFRENVHKKNENKIIYDNSACAKIDRANFIEGEKEGDIIYNYSDFIKIEKTERDSTW